MKILFLSEAVSNAHFTRPLVLANYSKKLGIDTYFATSEKCLVGHQQELKDFSSKSLYTISDKLFYERVNEGKFFYTKNDLLKYINSEVELINCVKPNLIVSDFRLTAPISAFLTQKPLVSIANAYWHPKHSCSFMAPQNGIFKYIPKNYREKIFGFLRPFAFRFFARELDQVRMSFNLKPKNDFRKHYTDGNFTALADTPDFVKIKNLPDNHFYLGPLLFQPQQSNTVIDIRDLNYVYITPGDAFSLTTLKAILKALISINRKIIISGINTNSQISLANEIPHLKDHCQMYSFINANQILPYCQITVCHGGSGTVYQSLFYGKPVICLPENPDQGLVANAVQENQVGVILDRNSFSSATFLKAVDRCVKDQIVKQQTREMQSKMRLYDSEKIWGSFLLRFQTSRKTKRVIA